MKSANLLPLLLSFCIPVQASVHITQNENGSYSVSKYEDGKPEVVMQMRDMRETITKTTQNEVSAGYDKKTESGLKKYKKFQFQLEAWMKKRSDTKSRITNGSNFCVKNNYISWIYCPKGDQLVSLGGPSTPDYIQGVDLVPATKTIKEKKEIKNPNYLQFKDKKTCYSDKAANPGATWIIGSHSTKTKAEFSTYLRYLIYRC